MWCFGAVGGTITGVPVLVEALDALPKVELYCHAEGTMRPQTVVELARVSGVPLPTGNPEELNVYDSLDGFLRVFWLDGAAHGLVYRDFL